jgi:hypothetical protein
MELLANPAAMAMARMVSLDVTVIGPVYNSLLVEGVLPSVV